MTPASKGKIPIAQDMDKALENNVPLSMTEVGGFAFSQSVGDIDEILPAATIVKRLVEECVSVLQDNGKRVVAKSKL